MFAQCRSFELRTWDFPDRIGKFTATEQARGPRSTGRALLHGRQRPPQVAQPQQTAGTAGLPLSTRNMPPIAGQQKTCAREAIRHRRGRDDWRRSRYGNHVRRMDLQRPHSPGRPSQRVRAHGHPECAPQRDHLARARYARLQDRRAHCAGGPVADLHIKSGIPGAMIVYPRGEQLRPAREIVVVEDAVYGTRDARGFIPAPIRRRP